jgi:hypothetical protein
VLVAHIHELLINVAPILAVILLRNKLALANGILRKSLELQEKSERTRTAPRPHVRRSGWIDNDLSLSFSKMTAASCTMLKTPGRRVAPSAGSEPSEPRIYQGDVNDQTQIKRLKGNRRKDADT